ncbi:MAG: glycosyltransferase family 2 protein [Phycisphaerae bacterium]|nr:glycosyltransferase family 2 protein [Phycisphaerae bacterium]
MLTRVAAVAPCFNRRDDLRSLLSDLAAQRLRRVQLSVLVIDNASDIPLESLLPPSSLRLGPAVRFVRLPVNLGGSGGFSEGLRLALDTDPPPHFLWLIDSDARPHRHALARLLLALHRRPDLLAVGSAIRDPGSGRVFECGGIVDRTWGYYAPAAPHGPAPVRLVEPCDYLAAASLLVRALAARRAGPFPDTFLNCDDVTWGLRLSHASASARGRGLAGVPRSIIEHHAGWAARPHGAGRYYQARNAFLPITQLGLEPAVRFRRAVLETVRAAGAVFLARDDLAELTLAGLRDAARGATLGRGNPPSLRAAPPVPLDALAAQFGRPPARPLTIFLDPRLRHLPEPARTRFQNQLRALGSALDLDPPPRNDSAHPVGVAPWTPPRVAEFGAWLIRLFAGPLADVAFVWPRDWPDGWTRGRRTVVITVDGASIAVTPRWRTALRALRAALRALTHAIRITLRD